MILRSAILSLAALAVVRAADAPASPPAPPAVASSSAAAIEAGPAIGWVLPLFTDKEGYHSLTLRGSAARFVSKDQIDVTGFSAVSFTGDATERVETVLLSPSASFFPRTNRASGTESVRLIHDDIEMTGRGWTYDRDAKKVSIAHDVRVTFQTQLKDILK